jgi:hypothetical protein
MVAAVRPRRRAVRSHTFVFNLFRGARLRGVLLLTQWHAIRLPSDIDTGWRGSSR